MRVLIDDVEYAPMQRYTGDNGLLAALDVRFDSDAGDNISIRDYLRILLDTLWCESEGFSGKRPFGNSGWDFEVYAALIKAGFIEGRLDEDGHVDDVDEDAHSYVRKLIYVAINGV